MHIVGGTYGEYCIDPHWSQVYGSGVRAAAALTEFHSRRVLHTYASKIQLPNLTALSGTFRFDIQPTTLRDTVEFEYTHPLSEPRIRYRAEMSSQVPKLVVDAENILRFGMIEGDAVVCGDFVTYDPQSIANPKSFSSNGSCARHLSVVLNSREANRLTGEDDPVEAGKTLLKDHEAEAVIIKQGSLGATLFTSSRIVRIPSFRTDRVWPIGSGDVFTALFHYFWSVKRSKPKEAALYASRGAALYCGSSTLPVSRKEVYSAKLVPVAAFRTARKKPVRVYLAGPFFTLAQRWLITETRKCLLQNNLSVFSPYHDIGSGVASAVVPKDIAMLEKCDVVLAIADGLDSGTMFEVGYARAKNKPVVVLVQNETPDDMKMLQGTNCDIVGDLSTGIYKTIWKALEIR